MMEILNWNINSAVVALAFCAKKSIAKLNLTGAENLKGRFAFAQLPLNGFRSLARPPLPPGWGFGSLGIRPALACPSHP